MMSCNFAGERLCGPQGKADTFSLSLSFESRIFRLQVAHLQRCVCSHSELLALKRGFDNLRTLLLAPLPPSKNCWGCGDESTSAKGSQAPLKRRLPGVSEALFPGELSKMAEGTECRALKGECRSHGCTVSEMRSIPLELPSPSSDSLSCLPGGALADSSASFCFNTRPHCIAQASPEFTL